jgi:hypothetical protein
VNDKIWFTYKARIQAQIRLTELDFYSQLLLVWYAILSATLSIVAIKYPTVLGNNTDVVSAVLSVALLGLSLAVANRDFRGRAIAMQRNYMDLQRLFDSLQLAGSVDAAQLMQYHDLLEGVENHSELDDRIFRVRHRQTLTSRKPTRTEIAIVYGYYVLKFAVIFSLFSGPVALWWFA